MKHYLTSSSDIWGQRLWPLCKIFSTGRCTECSLSSPCSYFGVNLRRSKTRCWWWTESTSCTFFTHNYLLFHGAVIKIKELQISVTIKTISNYDFEGFKTSAMPLVFYWLSFWIKCSHSTTTNNMLQLASSAKTAQS